MGSSITSAITTGLTEAGSNISAVIGSVLPIGLGIVGTIIAVRFGIRFFKGMASG